MIQEILQSVLQVLETIPPVWIFLAIAILPAFFFPVSPLLVTAAAVVEPVYAYFFCLAALAMNITISYLAANFGKEKFRPFLEKRGIRVPTGQQTSLRVMLLIRITPGCPFPVQNYLLGVMGVPFVKFFILSMLVQALYTYGFVIIGKSLFSGQFLWVLAGVIFILLVSLLFSWWTKRQKKTELT